jgi:hypothetical protein
VFETNDDSPTAWEEYRIVISALLAAIAMLLIHG